MAINHMTKIKTAIIGGGAAGLFLANALSKNDEKVALFERSERVGRKLSATGNGQGNVTNAAVGNTPYFSASKRGKSLAERLTSRFDAHSLCDFFNALGVLIFFDERGRGYPTSRQASALTDALRFSALENGVSFYVDTAIVDLQKTPSGFVLTSAKGELFQAETVALCTGGKAAKNFGTDGSAYALATGLGHTLTALRPSLVQIKTDVSQTRTLKGIRVFDVGVTAVWTENGIEKKHTVQGDIIFTDYGVSGDAVFRLSAFIADKTQAKLIVDFLPDVTEETIVRLLENKRAALPKQEDGERLCGIVNNQVGRAIMKTLPCADDETVAKRVKSFVLTVTGSLGFDYAQVTKGGVAMDEVDDGLQSRKVQDLYFAGEILDVDGECGGFNLQWAYASARTVAAAIAEKNKKRQG